MKQTRSILVVGNYCHDTLILPSGTFETLGGSASYISAALAGFTDTRCSVVAKVGKDFKYADRVSVPPLVSETEPTTHFVDDLTREIRTERLSARCGPLRATDLPRTGRHDIGIACGVAMEILPETLRRMRELCPIVLADAQALLRESDGDGRVFLRRFEETPFVKHLDCMNYLKASEHEARFLDIAEIRHKVTIIITEGPKGCRLVDAAGEVKIDTTPVKEVDATGAGDCFLAGFAHGLANGLGAREAAAQGNRFGALAVQHVGVPDFRKAFS